jgi:hypothetical protein
MKCFAIALLLLSSPVLSQEVKPDDSMKDCPMHAQHQQAQDTGLGVAKVALAGE